MKIALLLPGFLDSPDYLHMKTFEKGLKKIGYKVERVDLGNLWKTGDFKDYTITNFIKQIRKKVNDYKKQNPEEILLLGHSMGAFTAIIAGSKIENVTRIISLCPPPNRYGSLSEWKGGFRYSKRDLPDDPEKYRKFAVPISFAKDGLQYSAVEEAKEINKPLMIFIALDDVVVEPELTEKIVEAANNPYVVRQPNMGHDFRFSQKECNLVMKQIEKYLKTSR